MFINFVIGLIISIMVICSVLFNLEKIKFFTSRKKLLIIIFIVLFVIDVFTRSKYGFGSLVQSIIMGVSSPIKLMILFYFFMSKKEISSK